MPTLGSKINGFLQLLRMELSAAAGISVVAGEVIGIGSLPSISNMILGFLSGFFISGSALILNDYFDIETDRINMPSRALPSGRVSPAEALSLTAFTIVAGLLSVATLGVAAFVVGLVLCIIGILYNWKLKETGFLGNLSVAVCVASTYLLGGIAVGSVWNRNVWFFSCLAFLIDLGEEIAADAMDIEGDEKRQTRSIALLKGKSTALRIAGSIFALVILISPIPFLFGWLGATYLIVIMVMDAAIAFSVIELIGSRTPEEGRAWIRWIYLSGMIGVIAFIVGQIVT
jgi:geranylgeranylglycerol-phosphate geranylgeranyltransferase